MKNIALPGLIDRASKALLGARTSAEILEARDYATAAYTAAKLAARFSKAKNAHDTVIAAVHRAQADALEIEAGAKRRLADEYDAAQERGDVRGHGNRSDIPVQNITVEDIGLTSKEIHEARKLRDAERREPGITRRALDQQLRQGREPTKAALRRAVFEEEDDEDENDVPRKKDAFLIFANEALKLANYDGPIDDEVVEAAKDTHEAWGRLVSKLETGK